MKTRVLVVDDDHLVADTLSLIFNANGYECEARYSAAEGFERAKVFAPSMLLCDVVMPGETGLELADRIQESMPEVRMLLLSAYSSNASLVSAQARRMCRPLKLLTKPCRPDDLLRETQLLLNSH